MQQSIEEEDFAATVYQIGRLFRRLFDFQPMKSSHGPEYTLQASKTVDDNLNEVEHKIKKTERRRSSSLNGMQ